MPLKPWKRLSSQTDASFPIFQLRTDRVQSPRTKEEHDFYILESLDWVNVIPVTPGQQVVLIRQFRHGIGEMTLEIPGGIVEPKDSPEEAARRELREETGYQAFDMIRLGKVHPNPAFLNNRCHSYLAKDVTLAGELEQDDKEDIEVMLRPLEEIPRLIQEGAITHSLVLAAFYRYYMEFLPRHAI